MAETMEVVDRFMWLIIVPYLAVVLSPLLVPLVFALIKRQRLRRKALFVLSAASMSFGTPLVFYFLVWVPAWAATVFLFPILYETGNRDLWWVKATAIATNVVSEYGALIVPIIVLCWSVVVSSFLARRWDAFVAPTKRAVGKLSS